MVFLSMSTSITTQQMHLTRKYELIPGNGGHFQRGDGETSVHLRASVIDSYPQVFLSNVTQRDSGETVRPRRYSSRIDSMARDTKFVCIGRERREENVSPFPQRSWGAMDGSRSNGAREPEGNVRGLGIYPNTLPPGLETLACVYTRIRAPCNPPMRDTRRAWRRADSLISPRDSRIR